MTGSDLIVLAPWIIFGAAVGAICARLRIGRSRARHRRARQPPPRPGRAGADPRGRRSRRTGDPDGDAHDRAPSPSRPGAPS